MNILISGATGFVGRKLCADLNNRGHSLSVLSRTPERYRNNMPEVSEFFKWNPTKELPPTEAFKDIDAVIHLAGEPIFAIFLTRSKKKRIIESRKLGTRNLLNKIVELKSSDDPSYQRLKVVVSASAIGHYGDTGDKIVTEEDSSGKGFLSSVCRAWEHELFTPECPDLRRVAVRSALILGANGGMLKIMSPFFKMGMGTILGSGNQWMSWIHHDDIVAVYREMATDKKWNGVVNAASPEHITNTEFSNKLAGVFNKKFISGYQKLPSRWSRAASAELTLSSQKISSEKLLKAGFHFKFKDIDSALKDIFGELKITKGASKEAFPR